MKLPKAWRHLRLRHNDCFSCRLEALMVKAMLEGRGFFTTGPTLFERILARGRA